MARGRAHDEKTRAAVLAELLTGQSVSRIARARGLNEATVRNWKRGIDQGELTKVNAKKSERMDDLICSYLTALLVSLTLQCRTLGEKEWLVQQSAGGLATLYGVMFDRAFRMLSMVSEAKLCGTECPES
jgi:transposase-like protein